MKIGIDIDGVILDFERTIRAKAHLYDMLELKKLGLINKNELKVQKRYSWSNEEFNEFVQKYFIETTKISPLVPYAKEVINLLKKDGHELVIITARGGNITEMKDEVEKIFQREGLVFDQYYWKTEEKTAVCKKENIGIMIDDYYVTCDDLANNKIKTLYFRDKNMIILKENEYLKDVSNWGEIYKYIYEENINSKATTTKN